MYIFYIFALQIINEKMRESESVKPATKQATHNDDEFSTANHIFIDRVLKLSLAEKTFSLEDVLSETNTVLLAVSASIYVYLFLYTFIHT